MVANSMRTMISAIVFTALTLIGWILYCVFLPKLKDKYVLMYGIPSLLSITTMFDTVYLFAYVLDVFCPDSDPDGCTEEANVIMIFFAVFFAIAVNILYCLYKLIDRVV